MAPPAIAEPSAPATSPPLAPGASLEALPEEARGVIELFSGQLASIAFPDVDAAVLEQHAAAVQAERRAVEEARAALEAATVELAKRSEELTVLARRGLAYARIYAAAHPEKQELAAGLQRLDPRERAPKLRDDGSPAPRRGRPPKTPRPELPFATGEREANAGSDGDDAMNEAGQSAMGARDEVRARPEEDEAMESDPVLERDE